MTAGSVLHGQITAHTVEIITFKCKLMKHYKSPQALGILMSWYDDNTDDDEL
jgi:hypothetical protein